MGALLVVVLTELVELATTISIEATLDVAYRHARDERDCAAAVEALRRILQVRWDYFGGIGRAAEL